MKTDKTGKLAVVNREAYEELGEEHTSKDKKNTREECQQIQETLLQHDAGGLIDLSPKS